MKFFLDSANIEEIKKVSDWGLLDGVTTNPTLLAKEGKDPEKQMKEILRLVKGPVSLEVVSAKAEDMVLEAKKLSSLGENVVVKIPVCEEGVKAVKKLSGKVKTNATLVFSANQALLAAKAGATYVSPFIGRLEDIGHVGMDVVCDILNIFYNYGFDTQVIVASIRHPQHVIEAALVGAHVATIPFNVMEKLFHHSLTDKGIESFLRDWNNIKK